MSYVVDLVLLKELWGDNPGSLRNDFICPLAVTNTLTPAGLQGC